MAARKRALDDSSVAPKAKKSKTSTAGQSNASHPIQPTQPKSSLLTEEVDFPRGGGTSFTPLEVKAIRAEAVKEANEELFESSQNDQKASKRKRKSEAPTTTSEKIDRIRIEHLNYKRLNIGMKVLGQVASILPLALIISLPNQLFAHVPITNISRQFTSALEAMDEDPDSGSEEEDEETHPLPRVPELSDMFHVGQYVRAVVTTVHAPGSTDISGIGRSRDVLAKTSRRVELSLLPEQVNAGVRKQDLKSGFTLTAAIKSVEDHGYILDLGIPDISGFLSFADASQILLGKRIKLSAGWVLPVTVSKVSGNGRTCNVVADSSTFASSSLSEVSAASSVLPGALVQSLITDVHPDGIVLQLLGFFEGTVDQFHMPEDISGKAYKVGKKVKARVLYDYSTSPPRFALALTEHIVHLTVRYVKQGDKGNKQSIQETYPVGTILDSVKILRVETERGVIAEVQPGISGFVHISHLSDDHVSSLTTSGPWKPGSIHRARVTGYFPFDGLIQLSFKPSILEQRFLQVTDVDIGEVVKGTIKKLTDTGLFVSLSGNIDGVIWPNHYADIVLKHPAKRFKIGASIKCRVLVVDPDRKRISLTAKKTLIDSTLPIISKLQDVSSGLVTHAVVFKVYEKHLLVEFYNNLKAVIPAKEATESSAIRLSDSFPVGKVVRVYVLSVEPEQGRIVASIRQASSRTPVADLVAVEIGHTVQGSVSDIHKDNVVLVLQPSHVRALMSLKNLANHRNMTLAQLRTGLKVGDILEELVVVTRNTNKGFVIVANKPRAKVALPTKGSSLTMESMAIGHIVGGRVTRQTRQGVLVKITTQMGGILHPTDISDNYDANTPFPSVDSILKAVVVGIDHSKRQLTLSTRHSRMYPDSDKEIVDREISTVTDLHVGDTIRGYIKTVAEHGLFVTIGREIDARVQIRELFDEYVKDWKPRFQTNQLVKGRILSVDPETKKVEMSFRSGDLSTRVRSSTLSTSTLTAGQKIDGIVKKIEDYGLFIQIEESKLSGLCHKSQLSDNADADVTLALRGFREGDHVKAVILSIDKRRISLSLKPSNFNQEDFEDDEGDESDMETSNMDGFGAVDGGDEVSIGEDADMDSVNSEDEAEENDEAAMEIDVEDTILLPQKHNSSSKSTNTENSSSLPLSGGFQWGSDPHNPVDLTEFASGSSDENDVEVSGSKKKKRKRKEVEQDLTADMHTKTPDSNADFERLLLGSPNSSYLWIQYMSFQLQLSEIDKSREIARKAIRTINFREEQEKLNVWIALLNLENVYGTDETLNATFKEAARANDSKTVHLRLASIFDDADKAEKAEEQYKRTCKKFGQSSKVWTLFGEHYLKRGHVENARQLLQRCLQSLDKRKHIKTVSKFAQLEYKYGEPERGKTLFEGIIDSHPKRWDIWSIYMDMEAGQQNIQSLRNLFDRVLVLKMTSHKAKSFFKKWLDLERRIGDDDGAKMVKEKAVQWTQRASSS
ncbi:hypothetical protein BDQ12DRAFT_686041 [Crucibulum laeve]|uniref:S1 motif domain-containing protein n=1 Tax=Crucibulum laeve TaxID=68775 RepID=A0A5C3LUP1_9AGAR|nr:hypothetical protein BDQ12DRAFT_686041 [Crucibulum laeve]